MTTKELQERFEPQVVDNQIKTIRLEKNELEAKKKDINRICHELKHEMIQLNPKEKFVKNDNGDEQGTKDNPTDTLHG
jgi:hypothetical protein